MVLADSDCDEVEPVLRAGRYEVDDGKIGDRIHVRHHPSRWVTKTGGEYLRPFVRFGGRVSFRRWLVVRAFTLLDEALRMRRILGSKIQARLRGLIELYRRHIEGRYFALALIEEVEKVVCLILDAPAPARRRGEARNVYTPDQEAIIPRLVAERCEHSWPSHKDEVFAATVSELYEGRFEALGDLKRRVRLAHWRIDKQLHRDLKAGRHWSQVECLDAPAQIDIASENSPDQNTPECP